MLGALLKFELKYHFNQVTFKIAAVLFFCLGAIAVQGGFGGSDVYKNSPYVVTAILSLLSLFTIFTSTLFCANVVLRDRLYKMESVLFTTAIKRLPYFIVRFTGLIIAVFLLMILSALGIWLGALIFAQHQLGPTAFYYFIHPLLVFALPNVFFAAGVIFCTAILSKNVRAIYTAGVLLYILYMVTSIFGNSPLIATSSLKVTGSNTFAMLLDPFGLSSFYGLTKKWTTIQRNQMLFPVSGVFLANRIFWFCFTSLMMLVSYRLFHFRLQNETKSKVKSKVEKAIKPIPFRHFNVFPSGFAYSWATFKSQFKLESISLFKHIPFMVMLALWVFIFAVELKDTLFSGIYGIHAYPATGIIIEEIRSIKFSLLLVVFYGAEVIGREKSVNIQALIYSTPVRGAALWAAKCLSLMLLIVILVTLNIGIGIALQVTHGYFNLEPVRYLSLYYYSAFPMFLFVILIVFAQNLSTNKYVGMLLSMIVVLVFLFAERFGLEHFLFRFAATPDLKHSYFNGFGHYAKAFNWYMLYWTAIAALLGLITIGMWQNKASESFINRFKSVIRTFKQHRFIALAATAIWILCGAFIYQQTNVIGHYKNKMAKESWQVNYEKQYKGMNDLPQPMIKSIKMNVDLFPEAGKYEVKGHYRLKNESNQPISRLWISLNPEVNNFQVHITGSKKARVDAEYNQEFIELNAPLQPNAMLDMDFSISVIRSGFVDFNPENSVVSNGSYVELEKYVPQFGYNPAFEINDENKRVEAGLTKTRIKEVGDEAYHLIDLETTISTSPNQQVVTVGTLQKSWTANQRNYFNYKTSVPINFMFAFSSAKYEVKRETYKGTALRIYYQAGQEYNLDMVLKAIKDALDYGSANFSPYPLKQFTMAEIPQYKGAATAYPGVIFSAENISFLGNFSRGVNHSYAITAHEVAHQWWANKLAPIYMPGSAMLTESLAKYTEDILIEKEFGRMYLRNYLKADQNLYFVMRTSGDKELPLAKTDDQGFAHYQKGGMVMYNMKQLMGEQKFNTVLKQLIADHAYPHPRAKATDLVQAILAAAPEHRKFILESFNQVITYDMNVRVLSLKKLAKDKFKVAIEVQIEPLNADSNQASIPDMSIDLAFFDQPEYNWTDQLKPIYLEKHHFNQKTTKLSVILSQKPKAVAIDPYAYLLDENLADNVQEIK
jgi:ABC-2 type transport system permease protein